MKKKYLKPIADLINVDYSLLNTDMSGLKNAREATSNETSFDEGEIPTFDNGGNLWDD